MTKRQRYYPLHCPQNEPQASPIRGVTAFDLDGTIWTIVAWDEIKRSLWISRALRHGETNLSPTGLPLDSVSRVMTNRNDQWECARIIWNRK